MPIYKQSNSPNWLIEFSVDGKRYRRSSGTTNRRLAGRIERKLRQDAHGGAFDVGEVVEMNLSEATARYLKTAILPKPSLERTKKSEAYALDAIVRAFGSHRRIRRISSGDVAAWRDQMVAEGKAARTVNRYLAILRAVLNRAHTEWNALSKVPTFKLVPLNVLRDRYITMDEEQKILANSYPHLKPLDSQTKCNSFMTGNCNGYSIHSPRYRREI